MIVQIVAFPSSVVLQNVVAAIGLDRPAPGREAATIQPRRDLGVGVIVDVGEDAARLVGQHESVIDRIVNRAGAAVIDEGGKESADLGGVVISNRERAKLVAAGGRAKVEVLVLLVDRLVGVRYPDVVHTDPTLARERQGLRELDREIRRSAAQHAIGRVDVDEGRHLLKDATQASQGAALI